MPFLSGEKRRELLVTVRSAREKLESLGDNSLTVGILGGTGVGKSTLMNALAGQIIASTSHRRPHTDAVLLYRHREASLPDFFEKSELAWNEHIHDAGDIRHIVLCDLPDYDSIETAHRKTVHTFLDTLDVLLWVLSPEKYADGSFHDFLRFLPKDRRNCYFVLNKADVFFQDGLSPTGNEQLARVMEDLARHLKKAGSIMWLGKLNSPIPAGVRPLRARVAVHMKEARAWAWLGSAMIRSVVSITVLMIPSTSRSWRWVPGSLVK